MTVLAAAAMLAAPVSFAQSTEPIVLDKVVTPDESVPGKYWIDMEAYLTGEIVNKRVPVDVVLVLDTSGSMTPEEDGTDGCFIIGEVSDIGTLLDKTLGATEGYYYVKTDYGNWRRLRYHNGEWQYLYEGLFSSSWESVAGNIDSDNPLGFPKISALQDASAKFIETIHNDAVENELDNRISIVRFSDDDYYDKNNLLLEGNHTEYTELVKNMTSVKTDDGVKTLTSALNGLKARGATASDYGMSIANAVLNQSSVKDRESVKAVIMFTDGDPNHSSGFSQTVAMSAIAKSYIAKNSYKAVVYSVGVFKSLDNDERYYMHAVSSNYMVNPNPDGKWSQVTNVVKPEDPHDYFCNATTAADLSQIFKEIAEEIHSIDVEETAVVKDFITPQFTFPQGFKSDDVVIKVKDYLGSGNWGSEKNPAETIKVETGKNSSNQDFLYVTGYPFSEHTVVLDHSVGQKLIIKIPIIIADDTIGGLDIPTNEPSSGLYLDPKDANPLQPFPIPTVDLPISIIVLKEGLATGESSIFEIFSSKDGYNAAIVTLMLTGGLKEKDKVTGLDPNYIYKVQEADWSWTYEVEAPGSGVLTTEGVKQNPFVFKNKKGDNDVKNAEATIINKFEKIK